MKNLRGLLVTIWPPLGIHTDRKLARTLPPPIGRIRLSDIAEEWSLTHALNPRLLAQEVAGVLRTIAPEGRALERQHYSLAMFDLSAGAGDLTYSALANFFESLSSEQSSASIHTSAGPVPVSTVLLARTFIGHIVSEATSRAATAAGFVVETLPAAMLSSGAMRKARQPEAPLGSLPEVLTIHQAQQRLAGELSARELLEVAQLAQQKAEQAADKAQARADDALRQQAALHQENASLRHALNDSARQLQAAQDDACDLEERLEQSILFAEFLRANNPLSPPEIRLAFQCWCALTDNGQRNPSAPGGRGVHWLVNKWVEDQGLSLGRDQLSRLKAVVSWRKKPGAIATK